MLSVGVNCSVVMITHLLMGKDIAADVALAALDQLDVGFHAFLRKGASELVVDVRIRMQTGELWIISDCSEV